MHLETLPLPAKLVLAWLLARTLAEVVPYPLRAACRCLAWLEHLLPNRRATVRLAPLRQAFGSPPMAPGNVSTHTLLSNAFDLVEVGKLDAARRVARRLRADGCQEPRLAHLQQAIAARERRARNTERTRGEAPRRGDPGPTLGGVASRRPA